MTRRSAAIVATAVLLAVLLAGVVPASAGAATSATVPASATSAAADAPATAAQDDCSFPVTETDATGTEVTLEEEPDRIVVTAASAAQTIWDVGEQDRVVGMPVGADFGTAYLEGSENRTHVFESPTAVDREQVVALEPDLVIAPGVTSEDDVEAMRQDGLTVYDEGDSSSLEDIRENTQTAGRLLGACGAAEATVDEMDQRLSAIESAVEGEDRPSVLYWIQGGFTAPPDSFQNDLMEAAGAENAAADVEFGQGWALANQEQIVEEDPEYLLLQEGDDVPDSEAVQATTAVQEDNVIYVDANHWNQNAPRVALAVEEIAQQLHPDAFEDGEPVDDGSTDDGDASDGDADVDGENASWSSQDGNGSDGNSSDGDDGSPGFGVPAAIAALVALVGLRARY